MVEVATNKTVTQFSVTTRLEYPQVFQILPGSIQTPIIDKQGNVMKPTILHPIDWAVKPLLRVKHNSSWYELDADSINVFPNGTKAAIKFAAGEWYHRKFREGAYLSEFEVGDHDIIVGFTTGCTDENSVPDSWKTDGYEFVTQTSFSAFLSANPFSEEKMPITTGGTTYGDPAPAACVDSSYYGAIGFYNDMSESYPAPYSATPMTIYGSTGFFGLQILDNGFSTNKAVLPLVEVTRWTNNSSTQYSNPCKPKFPASMTSGAADPQTAVNTAAIAGLSAAVGGLGTRVGTCEGKLDAVQNQIASSTETPLPY